MTSEAKLKPKWVRVSIEADDTGLFIATSPDLVGLLVAETNLEDLQSAIPAAIADLYLACDEKVVVIPVEEDDGTTTWVKVPAEVARSALDRVERRAA